MASVHRHDCSTVGFGRIFRNSLSSKGVCEIIVALEGGVRENQQRVVAE